MEAQVQLHLEQSQVLAYPDYPNYSTYSTPAGMRAGAFRAMGSTVQVLLPSGQFQTGLRLVGELFAEWERCLSRFRPESEVSRLSRCPGRPTPVSPLLFSVASQALAAAIATDGLFDFTLELRLVELGYDRSFDELQSTAGPRGKTDATSFARSGGWREIQLDRFSRTITLPPGTGLDFGGIAKGMAVDAALSRLRREGIVTALVNAGGDLAVMGSPLGSDGIWPVAVSGRAENWIVPLRRGALATSGISRRRWYQGGMLRHHLLDPRSGLPVQNEIWSVTVAAERCEQAEVAAKAALLLGGAAGAEFLLSNRIAGLLTMADGRRTAVDPWPESMPVASVDYFKVLSEESKRLIPNA